MKWTKAGNRHIEDGGTWRIEPEPDGGFRLLRNGASAGLPDQGLRPKLAQAKKLAEDLELGRKRLSVTSELRQLVDEYDGSLRQLSRDCGISQAVLYKFLRWQNDLRGTTIDALCSFFELELHSRNGGTRG